MAYALNYPNAPTADRAEAEARKGFWSRVMERIERAQMARFRRELQVYSPHLYEQLVRDAKQDRPSAF
jgi:hypothetical protein